MIVLNVSSLKNLYFFTKKVSSIVEINRETRPLIHEKGTLRNWILQIFSKLMLFSLSNYGP